MRIIFWQFSNKHFTTDEFQVYYGSLFPDYFDFMTLWFIHDTCVGLKHYVKVLWLKFISHRNAALLILLYISTIGKFLIFYYQKDVHIHKTLIVFLLSVHILRSIVMYEGYFIHLCLSNHIISIPRESQLALDF